jgi:ATP/maltotriose-dependent transcriptional regulator MalT
VCTWRPRGPTFENDEHLARAIRAGASGFLGDALLEAMKLAADGKSNDEIDGELHLSVLTVRTHIQRAMNKLGARDRAQLVVLAYKNPVEAARQRRPR